MRVELVEVAALEGGHRDDVDLLAVGLLVRPRGRGECLSRAHCPLERCSTSCLRASTSSPLGVPLLGEGLGVALHLVELLLCIGRVVGAVAVPRGPRRGGRAPAARLPARGPQAAPVAAERAARGAAAHRAPPAAGSGGGSAAAGAGPEQDRTQGGQRPRPGHRVGHGAGRSARSPAASVRGTPGDTTRLPSPSRVAACCPEASGRTERTSARRPCLVIRRSADRPSARSRGDYGEPIPRPTPGCLGAPDENDHRWNGYLTRQRSATAAMSPRVTILFRSVCIVGRSDRTGGHQPQPGHEPLLGKDIERLPLRCVE